MTSRPRSTKTASPRGKGRPRRVWGWPTTRPGRWAIRLAAAFIVLYAFEAAVLMQRADTPGWLQALLVYYGIAMLLCGLSAGLFALIALWRRERSWLVWLTLLPPAAILFLLLGEVLAPH